MATLSIHGDESEGRASAERLAGDWNNRAWVPLDPSLDWARGAIVRLGEIFAEQPSMFRESLLGAGKGASTLSPRPFQGVVECLQNADDLGATSICVAYRASPRRELLIVHNGAPVTLADVGAMLLPWLSTKKDDPEASGRFGIGQRTLSALGGPIVMHAPPFHFVMDEANPEPCEPEADIDDVYNAALRHTMLIIPLLPSISEQDVAAAVRELNADALIFLKSIREIRFKNIQDSSQDLRFAVEIEQIGVGAIDFDGEAATVEIAEVRVIAPPEDAGCLEYRRYLTRRAITLGDKRSNKATGATTLLGVSVPLLIARPLRLYDRMPLPIQTGISIGLNAQFDPDSARSALQPNEWNSARLSDLSRLITWAALRGFAEEISSSWNHIPLKSEAANGEGWAEAQIRKLVADCQATLVEQLFITTEAGATALKDIAYEQKDLEGLLTDADIGRLRPGSVTLPRSARDAGGRWRLVLDELSQSRAVSVLDALDIIDGQTQRSPEWYVSFASLVERHTLTDKFVCRPGILLADGTVTARPTAHEPWVFVRRSAPSALATRLGLARLIHAAYLRSDAPSAAFLKSLEQLGVLFDDRDAAGDAFAILTRGPTGGAALGPAVRIEDDDLLAMRDAWAQLPRDQQAALGPKIGRSTELRAIWYTADGKKVSGWARPTEVYLPAAIDREVDSFAKAAGTVPGLKWVDPEYARVLKQNVGRAGTGAQRLLSAWGVAREPRLLKPGNERAWWTRDPTPAAQIGEMQTERQKLTLQKFTHLIDDHWAPDAEIVAADIAKAKIKTRRRRAIALLAALSRAWERRYSDASTSIAATAYNGYWNRGPEVRATWLARLAEIKWMPDAGSGVQKPAELRIQVAGSPILSSERSRTVSKFSSQVVRPAVLAALGVRAGPTQRELVGRLQELRALKVTTAVREEALSIYQMLAASLRDPGVLPEGRLTGPQLRNAFRASIAGPGLLLVGEQWRSPEETLRGPALFGDRRVFAPFVEGLEQLWMALEIRLPSAGDAIAVLRHIAMGTPTAADLGIAIRAYSLLADQVGHMSPQLRTSLRRLPLWTGSGWVTQRPVYAFEGESLLASAPAELPVWRPGLTSFSAIGPLLEPLGVVQLTPSDFRAASLPTYGLAEGEPHRPIFSSAVSLLRQELVRADQALLDSLSVDWAELLAAPVIVDPELLIVAETSSRQVTLSALAHMSREPLCIIVRSAADLATANGAGAAVASLFSGDRQKAAWAWASIWPRAMAGELAAGAVMPTTRAAKGDSKERLERLAKQAAQRTQPKKSAKSGEQPQSSNRPVVQVRKLRELDELEPLGGEIVNPGAQPTGGMVFAKRQPLKPREFTGGEGKQELAASSPRRTVLPPSGDREQMALDAVRRALRLDVPQLNDLRASRGIGVDAIDELRQCYEIKMSSSAGMPRDVTMTAAEVEAARTDGDFFLAVVTGLEDGEGDLCVRFIFDPLSKLDVRVRGDLTLTGIDKAEALEFRFKKESGAATDDIDSALGSPRSTIEGAGAPMCQGLRNCCAVGSAKPSRSVADRTARSGPKGCHHRYQTRNMRLRVAGGRQAGRDHSPGGWRHARAVRSRLGSGMLALVASRENQFPHGPAFA